MATKNKPKSGVSGATYEPGKGTRVTPGSRPAPFSVPKNPKPAKKGTFYHDELGDKFGVGNAFESAGKRSPGRYGDGPGFAKGLGSTYAPGENPGGIPLWDGTMKPPQDPSTILPGDGNLGAPDQPPTSMTLTPREKRQYAAQMATRNMDYDQFTALHGGKSTAALAGAFRKRFGGGPVTEQMWAAMEAARRKRNAARGVSTGVNGTVD